jgi:aspartyl/asparaginyl-tRNA synthetase
LHKKFNYIINEWGADLQSEHERYLVENFKCPVILFDYPANIKAFYMRLNEDGKTVRAMDILFPGIGELWEDHKEKSVLMFWSKNESRELTKKNYGGI